MASSTKSPGTAANVTRSQAPWLDPSNTLTSNNVYSVASLLGNGESDHLKFTNFGFSADIAAADTINGVSGTIEWFADDTQINTAAAELNPWNLVLAGTITSGRTPDAGVPEVPTSEESTAFGGATDQWSGSISAANVRHTDFGFAVWVKNDDAIGGHNISVDHATLTVHYTLATTHLRLPLMGVGQILTALAGWLASPTLQRAARWCLGHRSQTRVVRWS